MTPKSHHTPVAMVNVVGLVVAAAGLMIQYVRGHGHLRRRSAGS